MRNSRVVAGAIALLGVLALVSPVLPGDLDPPGPPGPTMKTLDQIPPTWDQVLPADQRFKLVIGGAAALDKETGLVWERVPDAGLRDLVNAQWHCLQKNVGGRRGWRLPTVEELISLVEPTASNPSLPAGHPFTLPGGQQVYWSSTVYPIDGTGVLAVWFDLGYMGPYLKTVNTIHTWCVRAGRP